MKRMGLWLLALVLVVGAAMAADMKMMSNKDRMLGFYKDVFNAHNPAAIDGYVTKDFVDHNPDPGQKQGMQGLKDAFTALFKAFPDVHVDVVKTVVEGDTVVARIIMTGTQKGEYMGMPASGKRFKIGGMDMVKIKDGKATDRWGYFDAMTMMDQLAPKKDMKK